MFLKLNFAETTQKKEPLSLMWGLGRPSWRWCRPPCHPNNNIGRWQDTARLASQAKQEVYCILQWKNREAQSTKTEVTFSEMGIRLISVDIPSWIGRDQKEPWLLFVAFSIAAQLCALDSLIYPDKRFCMRIFLKIAFLLEFPASNILTPPRTARISGLKY